METPTAGAPGPGVPHWVPGPVRHATSHVARSVTALVAWWQATRPGRALAHFGRLNGGLQCGGLAFSSLFSVFAALTIGYTALTAGLGSNQRVQDSVFDAVNEFVPGLVDTGEGGIVRPDQLLLTGGRGLTSTIAVIVLMWSAISFMGALRGATRSMLGLSDQSENLVLARLKDLSGFVVVAVGALVSVALTVAVTQFDGWLSDLGGGAAWTGPIASFAGLLVSAVIDVAVVVYVVRVLAGARPSRRDLLVGAGMAAVVFAVLRYAGTGVITRGAHANVFVASFAVVITLLLVVNFVARVLLVMCAWLADPPADAKGE